MVSKRPDPVNRRSILKMTSAAVVGTVGTSGIAVAEVSTQGTCVVTNSEANVYDAACPLGNQIDTVPEGVDGEVVDRCTDNYDVTWEYVDWGGDPYENGWVDETNLDPC